MSSSAPLQPCRRRQLKMAGGERKLEVPLSFLASRCISSGPGSCRAGSASFSPIKHVTLTINNFTKSGERGEKDREKEISNLAQVWAKCAGWYGPSQPAAAASNPLAHVALCLLLRERHRISFIHLFRIEINECFISRVIDCSDIWDESDING